MSRCFLFPPPGYEKKPTTDEPDLLKKEKRKEKKHKKDKKDKEKKDGKEKREKDRSEGKHKDKKEKKDKHRDKKKDKEKGKSSTTDEKKISGQLEPYNGENLHLHNNEKSSTQLQNGEYNVQIHKKEESNKEKSPIFRGQNGELLARNRIKAEDTENFKFVQELGRRIRDEEKGTGSHQFVVEGRKNNITKVEIQNKIINGATPPLLDKKIDEKAKMQEKEGDDKRGGKRKNKDRDKQRHTEKEKSKEKNEQKKAEQDKSKHVKKPDTVASFSNLSENSFQGVGIEGNFKKRKDMETNGVFHETEPRPNKMARHISNISPENGRKLNFLQNPGPSLSDKQTTSQTTSTNNTFKVGSKEHRLFNGIIPSPPTSISAKKPQISTFNHVLPKPNPIKSPPPVITNHIATQPHPGPPTKPPSTAAQPQPGPPTKPPPTTTQPQPGPPTKPPPPPSIPNNFAPTRPQARSSTPPPLPIVKKKPPRPDTKYLNQILLVPKLDPWCGFDDQEWLFSGKTGKDEDRDEFSKKTTMEEVQVQVWSEAKHIESVDVCALPYVIPY